MNSISLPLVLGSVSQKKKKITTPQYKTQKEKKKLAGAFAKHWVYPTLKLQKSNFTRVAVAGT